MHAINAYNFFSLDNLHFVSIERLVGGNVFIFYQSAMWGIEYYYLFAMIVSNDRGPRLKIQSRIYAITPVLNWTM